MRLEPRVVLEGPNEHMSSQYLCGTARPDTQHVICEIWIADKDGKLRLVRALIDCGATSIFISPRLVKRLGIGTVPAGVSTHGLDGRIVAHARDSQKTGILVQYFNYLKPVMETALVVPMEAYDVVLGLPWFRTRHPDIDWTTGQLLCLRTPDGDASFRPLSRGAHNVDENGDVRLLESADRAGEVDIELISAASMGALLHESEGANAYVLKLLANGVRPELLGTTMGEGVPEGDVPRSSECDLRL
jgi:hypothetical protein